MYSRTEQAKRAAGVAAFFLAVAFLSGLFLVERANLGLYGVWTTAVVESVQETQIEVTKGGTKTTRYIHSVHCDGVAMTLTEQTRHETGEKLNVVYLPGTATIERTKTFTDGVIIPLSIFVGAVILCVVFITESIGFVREAIYGRPRRVYETELY
ncbi:MAG TPA: hypothetical protein VEK08_20055 [Planctomycetota bacterium]|nr:hypothetical protein [Planctomycetota bacterium]